MGDIILSLELTEDQIDSLKGQMILEIDNKHKDGIRLFCHSDDDLSVRLLVVNKDKVGNGR